MFIMSQLPTAVQEQIIVPIIVWDNGGLKQIQDDTDARGIDRVGVEGFNPDFVAPAKACRCNGVAPQSESEFKNSFEAALNAD